MLVVVAWLLPTATAFAGFGHARARTNTLGTTATRLHIGPIKKALQKDEYDGVVEKIMDIKSLTREEAERDYDSYLKNPNDYALDKVSCYL